MGKRHKVGTSTSGRDLNRRIIPQRWTLTLRSEKVKPKTGAPSPGVYVEETTPSAVERTAGTDRRAGEA